MKRYRVVYTLTAPGGFAEFPAEDDADAIEQATRYPWNGTIISLDEVDGGVVETRRRIPLP